MFFDWLDPHYPPFDRLEVKVTSHPSPPPPNKKGSYDSKNIIKIGKKVMNLTFITPKSLEEIKPYLDDLKFLHHFVPYKLQEGELEEFLDKVMGCVTLIYLGPMPIGTFALYPVQGTSKTSYELHGISRPDLKKILGRRAARKVLTFVYARIFDFVFQEKGREKVVIKVHPGSKGGIGFALMHGFEKVPNTDRGRTVWKLTREKYLNREGKMDAVREK